jgi:hypothetical protein
MSSNNLKAMMHNKKQMIDFSNTMNNWYSNQKIYHPTDIALNVENSYNQKLGQYMQTGPGRMFLSSEDEIKKMTLPKKTTGKPTP